MKPTHGMNRLIAIAAGLSVLAPLAGAVKGIMGYTRPDVGNLFKPKRDAGGRGGYGDTTRTVAQDKRDAVKRRNVLRNKRAHR